MLASFPFLAPSTFLPFSPSTPRPLPANASIALPLNLLVFLDEKNLTPNSSFPFCTRIAGRVPSGAGQGIEGRRSWRTRTGRTRVGGGRVRGRGANRRRAVLSCRRYTASNAAREKGERCGERKAGVQPSGGSRGAHLAQVRVSASASTMPFSRMCLVKCQMGEGDIKIVRLVSRVNLPKSYPLKDKCLLHEKYQGK